MSKKGPGMLEVILASQKEQSGNTSLKSLEDALSNVDTISAADLKKLLSGGSIGAPASNVIDIAQDIKIISENSAIEAVETVQMADNIEKLSENQEKAVPTQEEKDESIDLVKEQNDLLNKIEENTRGVKVAEEEANIEEDPAQKKSGFISGIMGLLSGVLLGGILKSISGIIGGAGASAGNAGKGLVSVIFGGLKKFLKFAFKGLLKGTFITAIIGGLVSGIVDGIEEYKKSGNIKEALWKGLVGFLDFLSFGLIDEEDIKAVKDIVKERGLFGLISDGINKLVEVIPRLINDAVEYITNTDIFKELKKMYDEMGIVSMLVNGVKAWATFIIDLWFGQGTTENLTNTIKEKVKGLADTALGFVDKALAMFSSIMDSIMSSIREIHIPRIEFPIYNPFGENKVVSFGPIYPFGQNEPAVSSSSTTSTASFKDVLISPVSSNVGDQIINRNEENANMRSFSEAINSSTVIAPATFNSNVNNQTTVTPPIRVRDDDPALTKYSQY